MESGLLKMDAHFWSMSRFSISKCLRQHIPISRSCSIDALAGIQKVVGFELLFDNKIGDCLLAYASESKHFFPSQRYGPVSSRDFLNLLTVITPSQIRDQTASVSRHQIPVLLHQRFLKIKRFFPNKTVNSEIIGSSQYAGIA